MQQPTHQKFQFLQKLNMVFLHPIRTSAQTKFRNSLTHKKLYVRIIHFYEFPQNFPLNLPQKFLRKIIFAIRFAMSTIFFKFVDCI